MQRTVPPNIRNVAVIDVDNSMRAPAVRMWCGPNFRRTLYASPVRRAAVCLWKSDAQGSCMGAAADASLLDAGRARSVIDLVNQRSPAGAQPNDNLPAVATDVVSR